MALMHSLARFLSATTRMLAWRRGRQAAPPPLTFAQALAAEFEHIREPLGPEPPPASMSDEARLRDVLWRIHAAAESRPDREGHEERRAEPQMALCLSGGGIRSATFCLGVLQGLASAGWLERFHYLSTVSGGGYIGSWLSSWIRRDPAGLSAVVEGLKSRRLRGDRVNPEAAPVRWLRAYGHYLSPRWGLSIDFLTLVATYVRNLLLHWTMCLPLIMAVLLLPRLNLAVLELARVPSPVRWSVLIASALLAVLTVAYVTSDLPGDSKRRPKSNQFSTRCLLPLVVASTFVSWVWAWVAATGGLGVSARVWWVLCILGGAGLNLVGALAGDELAKTRRRADDTSAPSGWDGGSLRAILLSGAIGGAVLALGTTVVFPADLLRSEAGREIYAATAAPFLLGCYWVVSVGYVGFTRRVTSEDDREWWARSNAWSLAVVMAWSVGHALVLCGPPLVGLQAKAAIVGAGGGAGLVAALVGYFSKAKPFDRAQAPPGLLPIAGRTLLNVAALLFIVALVLAISVAASWLLQLTGVPTGIASEPGYRAVLHASPAWLVLGLLTVLLVISLATSRLIGANTFSLHSMYGNRLVRAYLGATRTDRRPHPFTGFDPDDNMTMAGLAYRRRPFHIFNMTLNLIRGDRLEWQQRKAAAFSVSPLHSGSVQGTYQPSATYTGGMTLARALTISGAAASPSMGYHTSPLVAFVMTFFNIRLGWWLPNPGEAGRSVWSLSEPASGLSALLSEALGQTTADAKYVYLTDGGHFENLGLYEMVLRRCHAIVVVDAGCDPKYEFEDLQNALHKIRVDLGIRIDFEHGLPTPTYAQETGLHLAIGTIHYPDVDDTSVRGRVIYVKPVLCGAEPVDVGRYAATHRDPADPFPQQSTANQFFSEHQFESYRELGRHSVTLHLPRLEQWPWPTWAPVKREDTEGKKPDAVAPVTSTNGGASPTPDRVGAARQLLSVGSWPAWLALAGGAPAAGWLMLSVLNPSAPPPPPRPVRVMAFEARPALVARGESTSLCYSLAEATGARIDPGIGGVPAAEARCLEVAPSETTTYTLTATDGAGGRAVESRVVEVRRGGPRAAQILTFVAQPSRIQAGESTQLCYGVLDASAARIEPAPGPVPPRESACVWVTPSRTTEYTLHATDVVGTALARTERVIVSDPPSVAIRSFTASPVRMVRGDAGRLCYDVHGARAVRIDPLVGEVAVGGLNCVPIVLAGPTLFRLTAWNRPDRFVTRDLSVDVAPPVTPLQILSFRAVPRGMFRGDRGALCYEVTGARTVRIEPAVGDLRRLEGDCLQIEPKQPTKYTLTATGAAGNSVTSEENVMVVDIAHRGQPGAPWPPSRILAFWAVPSTIVSGQTTSLCYSVVGAHSLRIDPPVGEVQPSERSCVPIRPESTTSYTLTAMSADERPLRDSTAVTVLPSECQATLTWWKKEGAGYTQRVMIRGTTADGKPFERTKKVDAGTTQLIESLPHGKLEWQILWESPKATDASPWLAVGC